MANPLNIAVVGATGAVGEAMLEILAERKFPVAKLHALASARSAGDTLVFAGKSVLIEDLADFDFSQVDIALFSAGASVSAEFAPKAAAAGAIVIDNTSQFRYDEDVPLVIPEVNPEAVADYKKRGIIANPNCSTIQMLVALKPIHDVAGISRINVATYQAVSGSGKKAINELAGQTAKLLNGQSPDVEVYPKQIAFNVIPQIDAFQDNGYTKEEMKMINETKKIMNAPNMGISATCVRVPVLRSHSEAVWIETEKKITPEEAREILKKSPGIIVRDEPTNGGYPMPWDVDETVETYVGRIREDFSHPKGLTFWVVADNLNKGAALNSIQIAEVLEAG